MWKVRQLAIPRGKFTLSPPRLPGIRCNFKMAKDIDTKLLVRYLTLI